jgi:hypothetical protein
MSYTYASPEEALNDAARDAYVLATVAKQGRLRTKAADDLVARLRGHADRMVEPGDAALLRETADKFELVSTRIKSAETRPRIKAAPVQRAPRPQPDFLRLSHEADLQRMASAGTPFSVNDSGRSEREAAEQTRLLREKNRRAEAQRAAQVAQDEPETPWWR